MIELILAGIFGIVLFIGAVIAGGVVLGGIVYFIVVAVTNVVSAMYICMKKYRLYKGKDSLRRLR